MNKKDYVLAAIHHEKSDKVPYSIRLTGEAYSLYGEQLMKDFYNQDIQDDLKEGKINFSQAVDLSIGNFMSDLYSPWWGWDFANTDASYSDPFDEPQVMPAITRNDTDENFEGFYSQAKYIAQKYQTFNTSLIWGSHWEKAYFTRGIENFLTDLAGSPEFAQKLLDFIIEKNMEILPRIAQCEDVDGILLGSDWGTQNDLIMSPSTWREMIKPGEKKEYELIKSYNKKVFIHSCGCVLKVMEDIVELGVDVLNPVQPECMDLKFLKDNYGKKITFWGGISTQKTLPYGTPEEVKKETEEVIKLLSKNGGYITCSSQEIQTDVPYENVKALIETAKSFT